LPFSFALWVLWVYSSTHKELNGSFFREKETKMVKTTIKNKNEKEAFAIFELWRGYGFSDLIASYKAYHLTFGLVGNPSKTNEIRLIDVANKYINKGGSVKDYLRLSA
jgi:hypothetical protein